MQSFEEWVQKEDPELYNEFWKELWERLRGKKKIRERRPSATRAYTQRLVRAPSIRALERPPERREEPRVPPEDIRWID